MSHKLCGMRKSDLHRVSSWLWCRQIFFDFFWSSESRNDSTALSTSRFLINCLGCFSWSDLHSGQFQNSWRPINSEIQVWQKLWPQTSAIRIGGLNISFVCPIHVNGRFNSCVKVFEKYLKSIWGQNLSILSKLNLRHSFLFWNSGVEFKNKYSILYEIDWQTISQIQTVVIVYLEHAKTSRHSRATCWWQMFENPDIGDIFGRFRHQNSHLLTKALNKSEFHRLGGPQCYQVQQCDSGRMESHLSDILL